MISFTLTGTKALEEELLRRGLGGRRAAAAALFGEGEDTMADSKEHYVPVDLSTLKTSGHVQPPQVTGDEISVRMGYGGAASDYAIVQHERMDYAHTVGGPKYLERPLLKRAHGMAKRLAASIRGAFE